MKYKVLIFDFDGTLADTKESIVETMKLVATKFDVKNLNETQIESLIGLPLKTTFQEVFLLNEKLIGKATLEYRRHYNEVAIETISLFEGVADKLLAFHQQGIKLAVASSKGKEALIKILKKQNVYDLFSFVGGEEDAENKKPAPDIVNHIMDKFNCHPNECLVIGDTVFDIEMGHRAFVETCGVTYGNNTRAQLERLNPNFLINHFGQLSEIVLKK